MKRLLNLSGVCIIPPIVSFPHPCNAGPIERHDLDIRHHVEMKQEKYRVITSYSGEAI